MKLCFIADASSMHTARWVNWFARPEHEISLINLSTANAVINQVNIINLPARINISIIKWLPWAAWIRRFVHQWKPDILHVFQVTGAGWLGATSGFHPLVLTAWGSDIYNFPKRSPLASGATRIVLDRADLITANSANLCEETARYTSSTEKIHLIRSGLDLNVFRPVDHRDGDRLNTGFTGTPLILCPRACKPLYNLHIIIQSFALILMKYPTARLLLIEFNPDYDYKKELDQLIRSLGINYAVTWIKKLSSDYEIARLFQSVDLSVSIPTTDSVPVSMLEAMACGVPVIASDLPSVREWIEPGVNGLLVRHDHIHTLSSAMDEILSDTNKSRLFCHHNLQLIQHRADRRFWMERAEILYDNLLNP